MKKVLLTILALTLTALAFWPAGGVKVVETPDVVENPQMVYIEDGSVVISWEADRQIYCQKLDTTGVIHWDAAGVRVCLSDSAQLDHHMVTDGQDVWFVWQDERADDGDIYAQKIDGSTGQRLWGDQGNEVCVKSGSQYDAHCALTETDGLGVAWHDVAVEPSQRIGSQYLLVNGTQAWSSSGLPTSINSNGGVTPLVVGSGEEFIVGYIGGTSPETGGIILQKFNPAGDYLFDTTGTAGVYAYYLWGLVDDGSKGCVSLFIKDYTPGISVQRFDSLGNALWGVNGVPLQLTTLSISSVSQMPEDEVKYGLLSDSVGGCIVSFWNDIYAQYVDSAGHRIWGDSGVDVWHTPSGYARAESNSSLVHDGNGGAFIAWTDFGIDPEDYYPEGILVQRVDENGNALFDENGLRVWLQEDLLPSPVAQSVPGACIITWHDSRNSPNSSLYAQIVDTTGKIGSAIEEEPVLDPTLELDCILDSKTQTVLFSWPEGLGNVLLSIYDVSGRFVSKYQLSNNSYIWDCRSQSGTPVSRGVYFVNLKTSNAQATVKFVLFQ